MQLTNTQRTLLEAAAKHPQKKLAVFPDNLKGGARIKVLTALLNAQLIEASTEEAGVFVATNTGLQEIGITIQSTTPSPMQAPRTKRGGTKQAVLIDLLKRPEGVTLTQMTEATGWQIHYADVLVMPTIIGNPACVAESAAMKSA